MEIGAATMQNTAVEKIKNRTKKRLSNPTPGYTYKESDNTNWKRSMQPTAHSSGIYKRGS